MLKKRLIGVVTVRNGWAVQSFGYRRYLPLGRAECLVENLDRWGADEILVQVVDRTIKGLGPDLELLSRLGRLGLETPLIYAGGISTAEDAVRAIQLGADRITLDQALHQAPKEVRLMSAQLGAQALIAALPLDLANGISRFDYRTRRCVALDESLASLISDRVVSELMLIDWRNEGGATTFEAEPLAMLPLPPIPLILFGGFTEPGLTRRFIEEPSVVAIGVGNMFAYSEHAYQNYKRSLFCDALRPPFYAGERPLEAS